MAQDLLIIDIVPPRRWTLPNLRELYQFRELLTLLTWRDIHVLYRQTIVGAPWAILQPLVLMAIYLFVFSVILHLPSNDLPFSLFLFTGLFIWTFFSQGVVRGAVSIIANGHIIRKVYFPHLLLPIASVLSGIVDLIPTFLITLLFAFGNGFFPSLRYLLLIPAAALLLITTLGAAFWCASLNTRFRDVALALPLILQVLFYLSPVVYSSTVFGETWRVLMGVFPITTIIEMTRWALTGAGEPVAAAAFVLSCISAILLLVGGVLYFQRTSWMFADLV